VISEAQKEAKEFKIIASPERPPWKTDLAYFFDAFIFVTKEGIFGQSTGYGCISVPQRFHNLDEAIDWLAEWCVKHPSKWRISWEKI